eukprot:5399118-Amphidinium_carterae.1
MELGRHANAERWFSGVVSWSSECMYNQNYVTMSLTPGDARRGPCKDQAATSPPHTPEHPTLNLPTPKRFKMGQN